MRSSDNVHRANILRFLKRYWIVPLLFIKSSFQGFVQVVWGVTGLALLGGVIAYYEQDVPALIFETGKLIMNNLKFLIWTFIIVYFSTEILEWRKNTK